LCLARLKESGYFMNFLKLSLYIFILVYINGTGNEQNRFASLQKAHAREKKPI